MRRIVTALLATISTVVLLFSYHTSTGGPTLTASPVVQTPATAPTASPRPTPTGAAPKRPGTPAPAAPAAPAPAHAATYTGGIANTRWGPVQVQVTVTGGHITASRAVMYPQGNGRDAQINAVALPILNGEVVAAQSAAIDTISGATVTSEGYLASLQSAIDQVHL